MNDEIIEFVINILKNKLNLTEFEKDILDSYNLLLKKPIDRDGLVKQICINRKYNIYSQETAIAEIQTIGKTVSVPFYKLTNNELIVNLYNQLFILCSKISHC